MHHKHLAPVLAPGNILLVDDDSDIRSLTRTFLEHEGYHVYAASDAERASHIFHSASHIDLLITDYYMPQRSGMELALELKVLHPALLVLVISGALIAPLQLDQMQTRGWNFLAKPFSLPQLLSKVHTLLQVPQPIGR